MKTKPSTAIGGKWQENMTIMTESLDEDKKMMAMDGWHAHPTPVMTGQENDDNDNADDNDENENDEK